MRSLEGPTGASSMTWAPESSPTTHCRTSRGRVSRARFGLSRSSSGNRWSTLSSRTRACHRPAKGNFCTERLRSAACATGPQKMNEKAAADSHGLESDVVSPTSSDKPTLCKPVSQAPQ